ncbi:MAG: AsmA-like C-terminal region-containing protein [Elusimicrobiota bacterium]
MKMAVAVCLLAVLGVGAGMLALKALFPEPKIRAWVVDAARKQLGREVRLEGIGFGLSGLRLQGLAISESPNFSAGTFVRVERFWLRPSWRALLGKRLVIAAASAEGLTIQAVKGRDGRFNYETLASTSPAPGTQAGADPAPKSEFNVRHFRVKRGSLEYRDEAAGQTWTVSELALRLDDFSLSEPFALDAEFRVRGRLGARPVDASLAFAGVVHPARGELKKMKIDVRRASVETEGVKLAVKASVDDLAAPRVRLDAGLSAAGKTLLEVSGTAGVPSAVERGVDVDLTLKTPGLDTSLLARLIPGARIPVLTIPAVDGALAGSWRDDHAALRTLRLAWAGGKFEAEGSARSLREKSPVYEGRVRFDLDIPEIKAGDYAFVPLPPKVVVPAARLDGSASYAADVLTLSTVTARLKQGHISLSGSVSKLSSPNPFPDVAATFALTFPQFQPSQLPVSIASIPPDLEIPSMSLEGGARIRGDDVLLENVLLKGKTGHVSANGTVSKAFSGAPQPSVDVRGEVDLPALTDKDIPFSAVPKGLQLPASHWEADLSYSARAVRVRALNVKIENNEVSAAGGVSEPTGRAGFDLVVKCKRFVLEELTRLTPQTRDLKLAGSGFFALSITGNADKPVFGGKIQFKGLGATVAELALADFTGTASFDERRIDVPNLKGTLSGGALSMDLTVKDYAKSPEIQLIAKLDEFDLGKYLEAKKKIAQDRQAAQAAKPAAPQKAPVPLRTRGRLDIGELMHPNATVKNASVSWDLYGVTPDLRGLSGDAKLSVGGGSLHDLGEMAAQSPFIKILVFPILIVQKIGRIGGIRLFPDFNKIVLRRIIGDYLFKNGVMHLRESEMDSDAAQVLAKGSIDLPDEALDLTVTAQVAAIAPIDVAVTGSMAAPKTRVNVAKFLAEPAKQLIEGLLKR